ELRPQSAGALGVGEDEAAAVELGEVGDDRQAEPGARDLLVEAPPAREHLGAARGGKAGAVVLDRDAQLLPRRPFGPDGDAAGRPLAGVVQEVTQHLLEVLARAAKRQI